MLKFLWNHKGKVALGLLAVAIFAALFVVCWKVPDALPAIMKFKAFGIHPFGFLAGLPVLSQSAVFAAIGTASAALAGVLTFGFYKAIEWCCGRCSRSEADKNYARHDRDYKDGQSVSGQHHQRRRQVNPEAPGVYGSPMHGHSSSSTRRPAPVPPPREMDQTALQPGMPVSTFGQ